MKSPLSFETAHGRARIVHLAELRKWDHWQKALRASVKDHRYYEVVAETLGFDCRAAVLEDHAGAVRAVQPFFFAEQDLVVTAPRAVRLPVAWIRKFFPRFLRLKMLMVGCAAGEGRIGAEPEEQKLAVENLREPLLRLARAEGASIVVWKDFPAACRAPMAALTEGPLRIAHVQIPSMPATSMTLDFKNFEEYLARRLSHAMRKNLRRKFKTLAKAPPLEFSATTDLGDDAEEALALYLQVFQRSRLQFEKLNVQFLRQLTERMPERIRYFLWRQEGRLVAFSICLVHEGAIYDEYLGLDYRVALDLHLYFVTFRDIVSWALERGLKTYYSTPLNYDPKFHLDFELAPLDLYFALPWPWLNPLAQPIMRRMGPTGAEPILARFANAESMEPQKKNGASQIPASEEPPLSLRKP
jgi:Acetyltransferase (GNAT) domain